MRKWLFFFLLAISGSLFLHGSPWLLRNGDFRYSGISRSPLAGWTVATYKDGCSSRVGSGDIFNRSRQPQTFYLKQEKGNSALMLQRVSLPAGKYRLTLELTPESPACYVLFNGVNANGSGKDGVLTIESEVKTDSSNILVQLGTNGIGEMGIRKIDLECIDYPSSPVPVSNGKFLNSIVLPETPTAAERFAAWEIMRLSKAMTGHAPKITTTLTEEPSFRIGAASTLPLPESVTEDGFAIMPDEAGNLNLRGTNDRGTLYAVYEFFSRQGCSWLTPGLEGETIPTREFLEIPENTIAKSPKYLIRGVMFGDQLFRMDGGWRLAAHDECLTWAVRNGYNMIWAAANTSIDFLDWRGGSPMMFLNHSWHLFMPDEHPEWWPLVNGKRLKKSNLNLYNQPCLSNQAMRDYAVKYVCDFFEKNPNYEYFSLSAEDEPCYWCECDECRKLDSDHGKGPWLRKGERNSSVKATDGTPMADRALDFVNYVAGKVAERFPDKKITTYCYGSLRVAPVERKLADNVVLVYCYYLTEPPTIFPAETEKQLVTWKNQGGVKTYGVYDYDNYLYPDTIWSGLRYSYLSLKELNRCYNALCYIPESHQSIWSNPLLYRLRADALWGSEQTFEDLVKRHCHEYYGKAGDAMEAYILAMDSAFTRGRSEMGNRPIKNKDIIYCPELNLSDLEQGKRILLKAREEAAGDPKMEKRIDRVIFAHNLTVLAVIDNLEQADVQVRQAGPAAYQEAKQLAEKYRFDFSSSALHALKEFYMPPIVKSTVQTLPLGWRFSPDKTGKAGDEAKWYANPHPDWKTISVEKAWTEQGYGAHHGVAWYETEFTFDGKEATNLAIYCGAIDGTAVFYLDGQLIGEQSQPAGKMWDKPFAIPLKTLTPGRHRLTIRVFKERFAAGIWKPVSIVVLE